MQILGKRSKVLLIAVAIIMLIAIGVSFATWDASAVKATNGDLSNYANAKVGDVITFGRYYQTGEKDPNDTTEYEKTPIEWIVVDKDERTGQLTLMSKYILASGSYFGNWYFSETDNGNYNYNLSLEEVDKNPYNQAYVDSTARAFLNNLERLDMGGDSFDAIKGYLPSVINSTRDTTSADGKFTQGTGLLSSVGFSNKRYWTKLNLDTAGVAGLLANPKSGLIERADNAEIYYQRPIKNDEYKARPATRGFLDEAFDETEKSMIVPKAIAGYTGHRWPDDAYDISTNSYVEGALDKIWLPSAAELNAANGQDWNGHTNDAWTNPSDETGSTVFEYFKNYQNYGFSSVAQAIKATRTTFAQNSFAMNYSIPLYKIGTTEVNTDIHATKNSTNNYWTRSPSSYWYTGVRFVDSAGLFTMYDSDSSRPGVRPCVILQY